MTPNGKSRDDLAHEANVVRGKLLHTIEQLDQRRHEVFDLKHQLQQHLRQIAVLGAAAVVATGLAVGFVVHRITTAPERRRHARMRFLMTLWRNPDRALRAERSPFYIEALRSVGLTVVTTALGIPIRRMATELLERGATRPVLNGHGSGTVVVR